MKRIFLLLSALFIGLNGVNAQSTTQNTKRNFENKTIITPLPVLILATYDAQGNPDAMLAAWAGQCGPKQICITLSSHQTTDNIRLKQAFTVAFADKKHVTESDYFGIVSAKQEPKKIEKAGMTVTKSKFVDAPIINEYPLTIECRVTKIETLDEIRIRVTGEIVNLQADESILDDNGEIDLGKMEPLMLDSSKNYYRVIGEKAGNAFFEGRKIK